MPSGEKYELTVCACGYVVERVAGGGADDAAQVLAGAEHKPGSIGSKGVGSAHCGGSQDGSKSPTHLVACASLGILAYVGHAPSLFRTAHAVHTG